jgi:type IV pilus assembly protein PilV
MKRSDRTIRMTRMQTFPDEKGFTLIETLMAIAIISIGLLGLAALQSNAISGNAKAQKQSMAIQVADNKIEAYKHNTWNTTAPPDTETETGTAVSPWGIFTRITDIQLNTPSPGIATVRVRVSWPSLVRGAHPVDIQTTIAQK